ncbi:uL15 family ribosomal protein [Candidatus Micrarchaeota archaeon]|nr:uL15 family ribosomal protein [Candidatus Micrarchaeota archaeon]
MARRIKSHKRKHYGNRTFGHGNKKNWRGKGSRGGTGRGGYHKQNWMRTLKTEGPRQTASGFVNPTTRRIIAVPLTHVSTRIEKGAFKQEGNAYNIDLTRKGKLVKVLGNGAFSYKAHVKANAFTGSAKVKIEKAGGSVLVAQ